MGSVAGLTDSTGSALNDSYSYDPMGNVTSSTGSVANPFTYEGGMYDSQTHYYYTGSCYYDPANGQSFGCKDHGSVDPGEDSCGEDECDHQKGWRPLSQDSMVQALEGSYPSIPGKYGGFTALICGRYSHGKLQIGILILFSTQAIWMSIRHFSVTYSPSATKHVFVPINGTFSCSVVGGGGYFCATGPGISIPCGHSYYFQASGTGVFAGEAKITGSQTFSAGGGANQGGYGKPVRVPC